MNVLVVDDTKTIHAFVDSLFEGTPHKLDHAFDGAEACDFLISRPNVYDIVLMDWEMPKLSGIEALKKIRDLGINVKIMMVTTKNNMTDIQSAIAAGANEYVMKPFTRDILFEKIEKLTDHKVL